jgi:hypothetical protein
MENTDENSHPMKMCSRGRLTDFQNTPESFEGFEGKGGFEGLTSIPSKPPKLVLKVISN